MSEKSPFARGSAPLHVRSQEKTSGKGGSGTVRSARPLFRADGSLEDLIVIIDDRELSMLGPAGETRETAFLPPEESFPGEAAGQQQLPVLIGSGTGAALAEIVRRLENRYGNDFALAVVDKEESILLHSRVKERFAKYPGIVWFSDQDATQSLNGLTLWQQKHGGKALFSLLNPFYLRLDRDFYATIRKACEASSRANFWEKAHYAKFHEDKPRILMLTSQYFLMGEIIATCQRLDIPHRLLQVPKGEVGQNNFVEQLLSAVLEFRPDFVFTINHLGVDREGVLTDLLERLRLPLASWFVDNPHLILYLYSRLVSDWTAIFTWDADNVPSLSELGFSHVSYLPLGVDVTRFHPPGGDGNILPGLPAKWNGDLSFVGNSMLHKVRERLKKSRLPARLATTYSTVAANFVESDERSIRVFIAQSHPELLPAFDALATAEDRLNYETLLTWEATLQYRLACIEAVLPTTPLVVGDSGWHELLRNESSWHYHKEMNYYQDLPHFYPCARINFNCTSRQMKGAVNQRVFDVPATGAFLLSDYQEQAENLFEPGREIICYRSPEEALELAREYLDRPGDREAVAGAARSRILREHTYDHRLQTLIAAMRDIYG